MNNAVNRRRLLGKEIYEQTAYGNPILVRSMARMRPPLTVYGHSTQDGTPSPENPVPIVSAGDSGEIGVTVQGGNLFDKSTAIKNKYISDTTGEMHDIATTTASDYVLVEGLSYIRVTATTFSQWMAFYDTNKDFISGVIGYKDPIQVPQNAEYARFTIWNSDVDTFVINPGETLLPYEPYKQPQTLTIPTPGGLPGIPVTSGGNYTDESGQQWVCDEVDLERGKHVQRVKKLVLDGTEAWDLKQNEDGLGLPYFFMGGNDNSGETRLHGYCNYFPVVSITSEGTEQGMGGWKTTIYLRWTDMFSTVEDLKYFLSEKYTSGNPVRVYYILATPIETDLPAEEISAYKALHTYTPNTTVSNDEGAWMKIVYQTKKSLQLAN